MAKTKTEETKTEAKTEEKKSSDEVATQQTVNDLKSHGKTVSLEPFEHSKQCPGCGLHVYRSTANCPNPKCDHKWERRERTPRATTLDVVAGAVAARRLLRLVESLGGAEQAVAAVERIAKLSDQMGGHDKLIDAINKIASDDDSDDDDDD